MGASWYLPVKVRLAGPTFNRTRVSVGTSRSVHHGVHSFLSPAFFSLKGRMMAATPAPVPHRTMGNLNEAWQAIADLEAQVADLKAQIAELKRQK